MTERHLRKPEIILVRHAHRDTDAGRERDNGLSEKGLEQAEDVRKALLGKLRGKYVRLVSSPKVRCVQTLEPLGRSLSRPVARWESMDEQDLKEPSSTFRARVERAVKRLQTLKCDVVVICSHGDWLPRAAEHLGLGRREFKKGEWIRAS